MPADEAHHEDSAGEPRARTGPRHAAPRKPLFTRLYMPAGKAIALAAMPTAVLMGMGLTPTLAQAKPLPKNPFQDGPCVTAPDEPVQDAKDAKDAKDDKKDAKDGKDDEGSATASPSPSMSPSAPADSGAGKETRKPSGDPTGSGDVPDDGTKSPEPEPEPSKSRNPLDPLGLGDLLGDLLGGGKKAGPEPSDTPRAEDTKDSADPEDSGAAKDAGSVVDKATGAVKDTVDKVTGAAEDAADEAEEATGEAEDEPDPSPSATDPMAPDEDGKKPFPCVVEKKDAGDNETPAAQIPNQPWNLQASSILLKGLHYNGVVNLRMPNGQTKQALKFTADDGIDIGDLHQTVDGPAGKQYHVQAAAGSTSTIRDGQVTMYTERLAGNLFGLIPIVFDPEHPPPLDIPIAYFTKVEIVQAAQFGGNLTIPGLTQYITG